MNKLNGNDANAGEIRVHPQDAARGALMFLSRVDFKRHERQAFDAAEAMLNAIAEGTVVLAPREAVRPVIDARAPSDAPPDAAH